MWKGQKFERPKNRPASDCGLGGLQSRRATCAALCL